MMFDGSYFCTLEILMQIPKVTLIIIITFTVAFHRYVLGTFPTFSCPSLNQICMVENYMLYPDSYG